MDANGKPIIIGGGPAGLMAAEALADSGVSPVIIDAMPSFGRKFLMAGKSGLNLTKDEPIDAFCEEFTPEWIRPIISEFGPKGVMAWAENLGQEIFTGSSGRVFPRVMKASPLLRAWLNRLDQKGVRFLARHKWIGTSASGWAFETPLGEDYVNPSVVILACGGASWPRLGSNGEWVDILAAKGVEIAPLKPANMGFRVGWSEHMAPHFGAAVKSIRLNAGLKTTRGEIMLSALGLEGGGIYEVSSAIREGETLFLDLAPDLEVADICRKLEAQPKKQSLGNRLKRALNFDAVKIGLLREWAKGAMDTPAKAAEVIKALPVPIVEPYPLESAISTAGGVRSPVLTETLMLRDYPGVFCAGEMLDWEAPTGGYLLTGALATGQKAGRGAAEWLGG